MSLSVLRPHDVSRRERRILAPYITSWSAEHRLPFTVVERRGWGIAYTDETAVDRDGNGVLWDRMSSRPHQGRPQFGQTHPLRQRRAMRRLLCQVCGGPADRTRDGILWLLPDHRGDWEGWPRGMGNVEPPVCLPCVCVSLRLCPALKKGAVALRVRECPVAGIRGALYQSNGVMPVFVGQKIVALDDPAVRWIRATNLVRELRDCTILPLEDVVESAQSDECAREPR